MRDRQPAEPGTVLRYRTVCHGCNGDGAKAGTRAAVHDGEAVLGYQTWSCPICEGREWLPGVIAPI
jgi:hypothetical protein